MKRLIDDPEIVSELRTELSRYASEQAQVDLERAYTELAQSLPLRAAVSSAAARGTWSALSGSTKLLILAAIGGSAALGVTALRGAEHARIEQPSASNATGTTAAPSPAAEPQPKTAGAPPRPAAPTLTPVMDRAHEQRDIGASDGRQAQPSAAARAHEPRSTGASSASRREIAQLARIKAVLERDPTAARRLIRAAQREFPAGLLVEEREGLDVIALFALAQHERARTNAEGFIARYPQSPLRPKLERLIADAVGQQ